ncbi:MAG: LysR family transcriptional regulator [Leifsonia sp.]|nr:LysR family transcriptional regulator [Leifsonia sp.]|tara:strand:- start:145024 stop:145995 length:972 start_codon:yes stop_codon:yes gene_type:complete
MNQRRLECFLAVVDELHFGRAARRMGMTQPSLSAQIRALEEEMGVVLLERSSRRVEVTQAGRALADGARSVLVEMDRVFATTRDVAAGRTGRLTIGSVGAGFNGILAPVLRRLQVELPNLQVTLRQDSSSLHQVQAIADRTIDVGILRTARPHSAVTTELLYKESFIVYLPSGHPLARSEQPLKLAQLANERFVTWPRELGPEFHDSITRYCLAAGFSPTGPATGYTTEAQLSLVAAGLGISFQAASNANLQRAGVVAMPLGEDDMVTELFVAYPATRPTPATTAFLRLAKEAVKVGRFGTPPHDGQWPAAMSDRVPSRASRP